LENVDINRQSPFRKKSKRMRRKGCVFTNWSFGGSNAQFVKVQIQSDLRDESATAIMLEVAAVSRRRSIRLNCRMFLWVVYVFRVWIL
jgi:hypothetical protein